jgi:uncharacterized membrane protein YeiH
MNRCVYMICILHINRYTYIYIYQYVYFSTLGGVTSFTGGKIKDLILKKKRKKLLKNKTEKEQVHMNDIVCI